MIKDIREVLHLYYGQEFEHEDDFKSATRHKLNGDSIMAWDDNRVLLLRSLIDIKDEELMELCKIYNPLPFNGLHQDKWLILRESVGRIKPTKYVLVQNEKKKAFFCIEMNDGGVLFQQDDEIQEWHNSSLCFFYLLQKGFDIFNLIERKMAQKV